MDKKYSYITLLTNDSYSYGVVLLVDSMQKVNTQYPLLVLVTKNVSLATLELLNQLQVKYEVIDTIQLPDHIYEHNRQINPPLASTWKNCLTKFHIFNKTEFDKVVFLDADILILKNLDHLFEKPDMTCALDGEYFNLWPDWPHFNSGCMVIEPNKDKFDNILNYVNNLKTEELPNYVIADQEILNLYYSDWVNKIDLHLNKFYNVFAPYVQDEQIKELANECYFIHYTGRKPWTLWYKSPLEHYSEVYYTTGRIYIENKIRTLDWAKIRSHLKLTVYAICKNELDNVEKWINSFGEADYVCVLDTGSTDGTWELLQALQKTHKNLIISQQIVTPWRYDKARNLSMELIPKDTDIFFMADLDEVIKESGWCQKVKDVWNPLFSRAEYDYHRDIDENGNIVRTIKEYRIHSKAWNHWVNIVHEAICLESGEKHFYADDCIKVDIAVWHYPKQKTTNYMELCEQDLKEYPDDWVMRLQLAIEYEIRQEDEKAAYHFSYIITHPNTLQAFELARCFYGLGRQAYHKGDYTTAEQLFSEGRLACLIFVDNYLEAMEMYYNTQQYEKVIELGKDAYRNCSQAFWCNVYDIKNYYASYLMGIAYIALKDYFKGLGYLTLAYSRNPTQELQDNINNFSIVLQSMIEKKEIKNNF